MTRTSGSVPDLRSNTRPVPEEFALGLRPPRLQRGVGVDRVLVDALDVDEDLRQPGHHGGEVGQALPVSATREASMRPVSTPSPVVP
jgi:hypothetical protein